LPIFAGYSQTVSNPIYDPYDLDIKVVGEEGGGVSIQCDMEDSDIESAFRSLTDLQVILNRHKINQDVFFDGYYIKIELK
jgi:hypothetical protein